MRKTVPFGLRLRCLCVVAAAAFLSACGGAAEPAADLVLKGGRIYTVDPARPWVEAVAVRGDRIVKVGSEADVHPLEGPQTRIVDLKERLALPGIIDGHTHFLDGSIGLDQVDLTGVTALPEIQERVRTYAREHPDEPWILGFGWLYSTFPGGLPNASDLDAAEKNRPVFLYAYDGHTSWANSAALRAAGIDARTPPLPVAQGEIVRDSKTGAPTGALKEGAAGPIERLLPKPSRDRKLAALEKGMRLAASLGVTSVVNCSGGADEIDLYDELRRRGAATLRTATAFPMPDSPAELTDATIAKIVAVRDAHVDDRFVRGGIVKFFADGVVESNTAAMLAPYANNPAVRGTPHYDARQLEAMVRKVDQAGLQIFIHAIGDAAVRMSLDALETAIRERPGRQRRNRLEHIEVIDPADVPRFGALGIMASMQPLHAYPEPSFNDVWSTNVGPARVAYAFAWNSIATAGGRLVFGSDWPVVTLDPRPGFRNAVLRQDTDGTPPGGWIPSQRVTLEQTIAAYTIAGAFSTGEEDVKGSITEGKLADLVIFSDDLFRIKPEDLHVAKVDLTIVGGREVYRRGE